MNRVLAEGIGTALFAQAVGAVAGVIAAHVMFELPPRHIADAAARDSATIRVPT